MKDVPARIQDLIDSAYQEISFAFNGGEVFNPSLPPVEFAAINTLIKEKATSLNENDAEIFCTKLFDRLTLETKCISDLDTYDIKQLVWSKSLVEYLLTEYVPQFLKGEEQPILECNTFALSQASLFLKTRTLANKFEKLSELSTEDKKENKDQNATRLLEECHSLYEEIINDDDAALREQSRLLKTKIETIKIRYPTYFLNTLNAQFATELFQSSLCAGIHFNMGNITASIKSTTLSNELHSFYKQWYTSEDAPLLPYTKVLNEIAQNSKLLMGLKDLYPTVINDLTKECSDLHIDSCVPFQSLEIPSYYLILIETPFEGYNLTYHKSKLLELHNAIKTKNVPTLELALDFHICFFNTLHVVHPRFELKQITDYLSNLIGLIQGCIQHFAPLYSTQQHLSDSITAGLKKKNRITSQKQPTQSFFNQISLLNETNLLPDGYKIPLTSYISPHQKNLQDIYKSVVQHFFPTHKGKLIPTQIEFSEITKIIKKWEKSSQIPAGKKNLYQSELAQMLQGKLSKELEKDLTVAYGNELKLLQYLQEEYIPIHTRLPLAPTLFRRHDLLLALMDLISTNIKETQFKSRKVQESNLLDNKVVKNMISMPSGTSNNSNLNQPSTQVTKKMKICADSVKYLSFNQAYYKALKELFTIKPLIMAEYNKVLAKDPKSKDLLQSQLASEIMHTLEVATIFFNLGQATEVQVLILKAGNLFKEYKLLFTQTPPLIISELEKILNTYRTFTILTEISEEAVSACKTICSSIKEEELLPRQSSETGISFNFRKRIEGRDISADTITLLALPREIQAQNASKIKAIVVDLKDILKEYSTGFYSDDIVEKIQNNIHTLIGYAESMIITIESKKHALPDSSEDEMLEMAENIVITLAIAAKNREPNLNLVLNAQMDALFKHKPDIRPDAFYPLLTTTFIELNLFKLPQGNARIAAQEKRTIMAKAMFEVIRERYLTEDFENDTTKERVFFDLNLFNTQQCQARLYDLVTDKNLLTGSLEYQTQQFILIKPLYHEYCSLYPVHQKAMQSLMEQQSWGSEKWSNTGWELLANSIYLNLSNHNIINYAIAYLYLNLGYFDTALRTLLTKTYNEVQRLQKEIKEVQTPIFMRSYQLALQEGGDHKLGYVYAPETITFFEEKTPLHKQIASVENELNTLLKTLPNKIEKYLKTMEQGKQDRIKNRAKIPSLDWKQLTIEQLYYGKIKEYAGYLTAALDQCQPDALQNALVQFKRLMEFLDKVVANSALLTNTSDSNTNIDPRLMALQTNLSAIFNQSLSCSQKNKKEANFTGMTADELLKTFEALNLSPDEVIDDKSKITPHSDNKPEISTNENNQTGAKVFDPVAFEAARAGVTPAKINTQSLFDSVNQQSSTNRINTSAGNPYYHQKTDEKSVELKKQSFFKPIQHWEKVAGTQMTSNSNSSHASSSNTSAPSTTISKASNEGWLKHVLKDNNKPILQHPRDYSIYRTTSNIRTWSQVVSQSETKEQPPAPDTEVKETFNGATDTHDKQRASNTNNTHANDGQYQWKYKGNKNRRQPDYKTYEAILLSYYPTGEAHRYQLEFNLSLAMIHERFIQMARDLQLNGYVPMETYISDEIKNALWYNIENISSLTFDEYAHKISILFHPAYGNITFDILSTLNYFTKLYPQNVELYLAMQNASQLGYPLNSFYTTSLTGGYPSPYHNTHYVYRVMALFMVPLVLQHNADLTLQKKCDRIVVDFLQAFHLDLSAQVNQDLKKELMHLLRYQTRNFENARLQYAEAIKYQEQSQSTVWQKRS
ncbi:MAG: hypothetical protein WC627_02645 [Legionella sp.]|jgi:hypothetical protein